MIDTTHMLPSALTDSRIMVSNFKCFREPAQSITGIRNVNIVVGRNNCGKSALVELFAYMCSGGTRPTLRDALGPVPGTLTFSRPLQEREILQCTGHGARANLRTSGYDRLVGSDISLLHTPQGWNLDKVAEKDETADLTPMLRQLGSIGNIIRSPLDSLRLMVLAAERNLQSEPIHDDLKIDRHGAGGTNYISSYINAKQFPSDLVERTMLCDLNAIMSPDALFTRIRVQQAHGANSAWEIQLEEKGKGWIPLDACGSGIKTILLILILLHLVPHKERANHSDYLFVLEEIENNLHPAAQRRLFRFLRNFAVQHDVIMFIPTHSSVPIDLFYRDSQAQILHVTHDQASSRVRCISDSSDGPAALHDLGVRASDILQANCIIWVEGPTDAIYIRRFIELFAAERLIENYHFQFVFYGGRVLAHFDAQHDSDATDRVNVMTINRHAILVMDSDKESEGAGLNDTKIRMIYALREVDGLVWVTHGREIENYLPPSLVETQYEITLDVADKFAQIPQMIKKGLRGEGRPAPTKVQLATSIAPRLTREQLDGMHDWRPRMEELCAKIAEWNADLLDDGAPEIVASP